jgi:hypothetical protein
MLKLKRTILAIMVSGLFASGAFAQKHGERPPKPPNTVVVAPKNEKPPPSNNNQRPPDKKGKN